MSATSNSESSGNGSGNSEELRTVLDQYRAGGSPDGRPGLKEALRSGALDQIAALRREIQDCVDEITAFRERQEEILNVHFETLERVQSRLGSAPVSPDRGGEADTVDEEEPWEESRQNAGVVDALEEFYESSPEPAGEDAATAPPPNRPHPATIICPQCGITGRIRTRVIGKRRPILSARPLQLLFRRGGLAELIRYYRGTQKVILATCLNCSTSWQV